MHPDHRRERGMTLLEIMIVLAILALVMGLIVGPKLVARFHESQRNVASLAVHRYADQDYPVWVVTHPSAGCPAKLADLSSADSTTDPWGSDYRMHCGSSAPATDLAFGAASFGEDRHEHTDDDIESWRDRGASP